MEHMRDIMLCIYAPLSEEITSLPLEMQEKLKKQAEKANGERILRAIEILSKLESEIKLHSRPEIQLETAVVRICTPQLESDLSAIEDRLNLLENKIKNGVTVSKTENKTDDLPWIEEKPVVKEAPKPKAEVPKPQPKAKAPASGHWSAVTLKIKQVDLPLYMMIRSFDGMIQGDKFNIYIPESAKHKEALITNNIDSITSAVKEVCGQDLRVLTVIGEKPKDEQDSGNDLMSAALDLFS